MTTLLGIGSRVCHAEYGDGVVINLKANGYTITFLQQGVKVLRFDAPLSVIEAIEPDDDQVGLFDVEQALTWGLQRWVDQAETVPLGDKWKGGKLGLKPGRADLSQKEMPTDAYFRKVVTVRECLKVLEQRISTSVLDDEAKVDIQQHIVGICSSLTSYNLLFKHQHQQRTGEKTTVGA